jgi:hypothetical protein
MMTRIEAWLQASTMMEKVLHNYSLKSYTREATLHHDGHTVYETRTVTAVEQYLEHIQDLAEWLIEKETEGDIEPFITSVLDMENNNNN